MQIIDKGNKTWIIDDGRVRCFVLEGNDYVALIDSSMVLKNLKDIVKSIVDKPIILINTHADRDHIACNEEFEEAYMGVHEIAFYRSKINYDIKVHPLYEKDVIDLGNRKLEVIDLIGHSLGSIGLYDINNKVLFAGDSIQSNGRIYLFGEHRNAETYLSSLDRLNKRKDDFKEIWPSHHDLPIDNSHIEICKNELEEVLAGKLSYETVSPRDGLVVREYKGKVNTYILDNID